MRSTQIKTDHLYDHFKDNFENFIHSCKKGNRRLKSQSVEELANSMVEAMESQLKAQGINPTMERKNAAKAYAKRELEILDKAPPLELKNIFISVAFFAVLTMTGGISLPVAAAITGMAAIGGVMSCVGSNADNPKSAAGKVTTILNGMLEVAFTDVDIKTKAEIASHIIERSDHLTSSSPILANASSKVEKFLEGQGRTEEGKEQVLSEAANALVAVSLDVLQKKGLIDPTPQIVETAQDGARNMLLAAKGRRPHTSTEVKIEAAKAAKVKADMDDDHIDYDDDEGPGLPIVALVGLVFACGAIAAAVSYIKRGGTDEHVHRARSNIADTTTELIQAVCNKIGNVQKFDNALTKALEAIETGAQGQNPASVSRGTI